MPLRNLTDADIQAIAEALRAQKPLIAQPASATKLEEEHTLLPHEIRTIKKFVEWFDTASTYVGRAVVSAVLLVVGSILVAGFWSSLKKGLGIN